MFKPLASAPCCHMTTTLFKGELEKNAYILLRSLGQQGDILESKVNLSLVDFCMI